MKSIFARNDTGRTAIKYARQFRAERRLSAMPVPVKGGLDISGRNRTRYAIEGKTPPSLSVSAVI